MTEIKKYRFPEPLLLECGQTLDQLEIAYCTYGTMNDARDNVIWVNHALTANSDVADWWPGFYGEGKLFDPSKYFIVCANMLGSCYGSTWAGDIDANTGKPYGKDFPLITIRDIVRCHQALKNFLGIRSVYLSLGGSMGGQQTLEWAIMEPGLFRHIALLACNAWHSPWGIAFNEAQRMALLADTSLFNGGPQAGEAGLQAARAVAMLSYRHYITYQLTQSDDANVIENHRASTYQRYQGKKLSNRFKALAYLSLSKTMDNHHIGRKRQSPEQALALIQAKTLVIGIDTDVLFPLSEQEYLASHIQGASLAVIHSDYGHDGFLLEYDQIGMKIDSFLQKSHSLV